MYCLIEGQPVNISILIVLTEWALILASTVSCFVVTVDSPGGGAKSENIGFNMYSIIYAYDSSRNRELQSSTMIEIACIEFSLIEISWCCRLSVRKVRSVGQALNPPRTMIIDITLETVFLTTGWLSKKAILSLFWI